MKFARLLCLSAIIVAFSNFLFAQTAPDLENGFKNYGSYHGSDIDTVDLKSGNLMVHIPMPWSYPQRGGAIGPRNLLTVSSKTWNVKCVNPDNTGNHCFWMTGGIWRDLQVATAGSGLGFDHTSDLSVHRTWGYQTDTSLNVFYFSTGYSVTTPDGGKHAMAASPSAALDPNGNPMAYDATDASGFHIVLSNPNAIDGTPDTAVAIDRHGNRYSGGWVTEPNCRAVFDNQFAGNSSSKSCQQATRLSGITDANGNVFTPTNDTMGRPFSTFAFGGASDSTGCVLSGLTFSSSNIETYPGPNGATNQVKLCYATVNVATAFGVSGIDEAQSTIARNNGSAATATLLVTVILPDGSKWVFNYDSYINLVYIGLPTGGSISYGWQTLNLGFPCNKISRVVASRTLNDNNGHSYPWNYFWGQPQPGSLALISNRVSDPLGNDTVHVFTDPAGRGTCLQYETQTQQFQGASASGQLLKQVDTTYLASNVGYVVPANIQTTLLPSNKVSLVTKSYDSGLGTGFPIFGNVVSEKEYDWGQGTPGALLRETDTTYQWQVDSRYLTARLLDLPSSVVIISLDPNANVKASCPAWDSNGNAVTKACMAETDYTYDEAAYITGYEATVGALPTGTHIAAPNPVRGLQTTVGRWLNTTNSFVASHTNWYDTGELHQTIDPLGNTTTHSYDPFYAGAYSTQMCSPSTAGIAHCVSGQYDSNTGQITSYTDENHQVSTYNYDNMARPIQVIHPDQGQTLFSYPDAVTVTHQTLVTNSPSAVWDTVAEKFDGLARPMQSQHATPTCLVMADTGYDDDGRVGSVSNPYCQGSSHSSDPTYGLTSTIYDALNRPTSVTRQDGSTASNNYPDNCTLSIDESGKQKKTCSDALGRLTTVFEDPSGLNYETDYQYDALSNLIRVDQKGTAPSDSTQWRTRTFIYDSLSRLQTASNPESGTISYSYYANGNVQTKTDGRVTTTFNYDALNRLTNKSYSDGKTSAAHFMYDVPSSWGYTITNVIGRLSEAYIDTCPDGSGNKSGGNSIFSYDPMGRILLQAQATPSNCGSTSAWTVAAAYDLAGNMTSITYPSGRKVVNQYDGASRLNQVQYQSWQGVTYYYGTYNYLNVTDFFPSGAPKSVTLGSGMAESYQFNRRLQPSRDTVNVPGVTTFLDRTYGYGTQNNGNVMSVADQLNSAYTQNFTYDPLNRLATAGEAGSRWGLSFGYDAWGNFLQQNVTAGTASAHAYAPMTTNRLGSYTYDATGNMAADDYHQYAYDGENRITTVDTAAAKYSYDANGNRVRKDVGANYTEYIYFGSNIIAEHDQAGGWSDYIFANGKRIAKADDYEHQIQVSGQVCSACGTQTYSLAFSNLGSLAGHVIQSGDILRWQQWQNTGTFGGIAVNLTDGTKSVTIGSAANQWQSFAVDLSTLHGKTISSIALYEDPATQPGTWTLYYQDIVFTAANGTVQPLFSQNLTVPALTGSGTSGVTSVATAIHVCLDPGCAPSNTTTYYHGDQIGSSRLLSNGHGYPVWQGTFLPFGEEYNPQITDNHYKFTGKERDGESGLDYLGARYYGSSLGRFISVDPKMLSRQRIVDPQQWNMYTYVRNNPLGYIDPDGRELKMVVFLEGGKGNNTYTKNGVMRAANAIHDKGVKNVTVEFRSGTPDSKTLSGLNKDHVTVFRVQDPSEKSLAAKGMEAILGGSTIGQSEKTTNVVHIYPTGSGFEGMETHEVSNVVKHEELHQAGESFVADLIPDTPGNVMDPGSYDTQLEERELKIDSYQGLELKNKFNSDNEVDSNPGGATCVGGCPSEKAKKEPQ